MVYSIHNWGRIACIVYNIILIAAGLYNLYILTGSGMLYSTPSAVNLINIILFSIATYYLLSGETSSFYKNGKESFPPKDADWQITIEAANEYGTPGNYVNGANIAGFTKVAEAMMAQGVV